MFSEKHFYKQFGNNEMLKMTRVFFYKTLSNQFIKVAAIDMRYFSRNKFSRCLVHKKNYSLI